jgi:S1-C subfamily serine protease
VLKIHGTNECGNGIEGSGFLYAGNRLMTNAHVVAGVDDPEVLLGESSVPAEVVYYNPDIDVAVLALDSGATPHLTFDRDAEAQAPVAILGYPQDGPYDVQPGRIRAEQRLRSPNIYNRGTVIREVYSLRGLVRPGNSGGPIVSSAGDVVGVVFAASVTDDETGYALTADQVSQSAATGITNDAEVSTGDCVS